MFDFSVIFDVGVVALRILMPICAAADVPKNRLLLS